MDYGLWLLVALLVLIVLVFLLSGKRRADDPAESAAATPPPPADVLTTAPLPADPFAPVAPILVEPAPAPASPVVDTPPAGPEPAAPAEPAAPIAGDPADADDLLRLKGVGPKLKALLIDLGVTRYAQIAAWTDSDLATIDAQLGAFKGRPVRDHWVDQAKYLAAGDIAGFEAKYGKL